MVTDKTQNCPGGHNSNPHCRMWLRMSRVVLGITVRCSTEDTKEALTWCTTYVLQDKPQCQQ